MSYQALYRKWRPSGFDGLVGQDAVVTTLKNQIKSDRIGHAYLFCGTRGTGKTSAAKIFAEAVNCPHAKEHDGSPCGECETCRAIRSGRAMNVFEIDAASNNGVDNIRDIREQVEYPPVTGRYKVYIIDEVHMLSAGAFNALLKTLEEPPAYVIFILATTDPQKIPATILSRCQRYDFRRMSKSVITAHLKEITDKEGVNVEDRALAYIAEAADGSMRDSLSILDQCLAYDCGKALSYEDVLNILGASDDKVYSGLLHDITAHDTETALEKVAELINAGSEPGRLINDFIMYLRNVLLVKSMGSNDMLELSDERYETASEDAKLTDRDSLIHIISSMAELANRIRFSAQKRVGLEVELIRLCSFDTAANAAAVQVQSVQRQSVSRPSAASARLQINITDSRETRASVNASGGSVLTDSADGMRGDVSGSVDRQSAGASGSGAVRDRAAVQEQGRGDQGTGINAGSLTNPESTAGSEDASQAAQGSDGQMSAASVADLIRQNWNILAAELSASNRPLFNGTLIKEEHGNIVIVFKNKMNFTLAAGNAEENGLIRLRELAADKLGIRANFKARVAKPGEISSEIPRATQEELAKINFPISIED